MMKRTLLAALFAPTLFAQIDASIVERMRPDLVKQASDPALIRKGGTYPEDWPYQLPEGVRTRQITFYSDGTPCYGKLFLPPGFTTARKYPGVVLGHGFNGILIGIEKFGARLAAKGLVALVIDYRTYGFSSSQPMLLDEDTSNDSKDVWEREARVRLKRTRLHHFRQIEDYRAAISFLQGEPGVDPEKIGIWGSSNSGAEVISVAGLDARVKAVVAQVSTVSGRNATGPAQLTPALLEDAVLRARKGQGGEADGGFSFRTKIDVETQQTGREHRPWLLVPRVPQTTAILWMPAEKDELMNPRAPSGPFEASKVFKGASQVVELPAITHFQAYSGPAFEITSGLAAEWFLKYLAAAKPATPAAPATSANWKTTISKAAPTSADQFTARDVWYWSEGVRCYGRLFLPKITPEPKVPGIVLAPGWGETYESVESQAAWLASRGIAALAIDYRGWGKSGGYVYTNEQIRQDDRFRFLEVSTPVTIRRKRLVPLHQIDDIRNALSFLAGEQMVDPARLGVWGAGIAAGHAIAAASVDSRIKAIIGQAPVVPGETTPAQAWAPPAALSPLAIKLARTGLANAAAADSQLAVAEYAPFHNLDQLAEPTGVLMFTSPSTAATANAIAARRKSVAIESTQDGAFEWLRKQFQLKN